LELAEEAENVNLFSEGELSTAYLTRWPAGKILTALIVNGRGERIRTSDPLVPNQVLYQAEPLPEIAAKCPHEHLKVYQITV
jgi:hypothetical protein